MADADPRAERPPPRDAREARIADNPGTATYGAIVVTAAIAAAGSHDDRPWAVLAKVAATLVVFWLAHVHSAVIADRFATPDGPFGAALKRALHHELIMLEIAAAPILLLLGACLALLSLSLATNLALWAGVGELFAIGVLRGRRAHHRLPATLALGAAYALAGAGLVALKVAIH